MNGVIKRDRDRMRLFKRHGYDMSEARRFVLAKAGLAKGSSILEIGTGRGHMAAILAKKGLKFTSIDLDSEAQKAARVHLKAMRRHRSVILKIMNAERLRYKAGSFDDIISVNFMHHATRPARCLKEMIRVARRKIVIADINKRGQGIMEKVHRLDSHGHEESKISFPEMKAMLGKAGMETSIYRDSYQNVIVAKKGGQYEDMRTH